MLLRTILLNLLLIFSCFSSEAQIYKDNTPLHKFFKNNFDSTIIYHQWSSWYSYPKYYIVAKKDSSVYYFSYKSEYSKVQGRQYPADLLKKFTQEEVTFKSTIPDTNRYFLPVYIQHYNRTLFWSQISSFNIWNLKEINESANGCEIEDDSYDTYYLVTKKGVETKTYYASDFYEKCKPGNNIRINEIKTRNTILKIFKD